MVMNFLRKDNLLLFSLRQIIVANLTIQVNFYNNKLRNFFELGALMSIDETLMCSF